ncbi:MAG: sulfotransferase family protein [Candidatus Binataceae bacterium]
MAVPDKFTQAEAELHEAAIRQTGLNDLGDTGYLPGLRVLLGALDADLKLTGVYRERVFGSIVGVLIARLYAQQGWREHPESSKTAIRAPLIIAGIPRTGTTVLHKALSMDPQFQGLELWLAQTPMVRPPRDSWAGNRHFRNAVAGMAAVVEVAPLIKTIHDMVADEPDECLNAMVQSFVTIQFGSTLHVPSYHQWYLAQDETPSYRRYADLLRLVGFNDQDKRWLLKNPGHVLGIEPLLKVFPDARIVHTHRNPLVAVPSTCSLIETFRTFYLGDQTYPHELGRMNLELWSIGLGRILQAHERQPGSFYDVQFEDLNADPLGVVRGIYQWAGLALKPDVEQKMKNWLDTHSEGKGGIHRYTAEHFGLSDEILRDQYHEYMARYYP